MNICQCQFPMISASSLICYNVVIFGCGAPFTHLIWRALIRQHICWQAIAFALINLVFLYWILSKDLGGQDGNKDTIKKRHTWFDLILILLIFVIYDDQAYCIVAVRVPFGEIFQFYDCQIQLIFDVLLKTSECRRQWYCNSK